MTQVSLNTKAGKIFWASLIAYCLMFAVFYINTQYSFNKLDLELKYGRLSSVPLEACATIKGCTDAHFLPYLVLNEATGKYIAQVDITIGKKNSNFDESPLNILLEKMRPDLPWYINNKLESIQVGSVNGNMKPSNLVKAEWYLSLEKKLGELYE
jgi:hypothetical protein